MVEPDRAHHTERVTLADELNDAASSFLLWFTVGWGRGSSGLASPGCDSYTGRAAFDYLIAVAWPVLLDGHMGRAAHIHDWVAPAP